MPDDVTLNAGTGGETLATDQAAGGEHYQQVKLVDGTADSTTVIASGGGVEAGALRVTLANDSTGLVSVDDNGGSLTVDGPLTDTEIRATALPVSAASLPLPAGAATSANQLADGHNVTVDNASGGSAVNIQDGGNSITVDGSVAATNAGTFPVQEDGPALTALQILDNAVKVDDAAFTLTTDSVSMAGAIRDDALTTLGAVDGDAVPLRVGSTGALHVTGGGGGTEYTEDVATPNPIVGTKKKESLRAV